MTSRDTNPSISPAKNEGSSNTTGSHFRFFPFEFFSAIMEQWAKSFNWETECKRSFEEQQQFWFIPRELIKTLSRRPPLWITCQRKTGYEIVLRVIQTGVIADLSRKIFSLFAESAETVVKREWKD